MATPRPDPAPARPRSRRPGWLLPLVVVGAVVGGVVLWLTQPWLLFVDTVADEQLPVDLSSSAAAPPPAASPSEGPAGQSDTPSPPASSAPSAAPTPSSAPSPSVEPSPPAPQVLAQGSFISRDHGTSGQAAIVSLPDGSRVLTIEGLDTDNGPDLFVYLDDTPADGPEGEWDDGVSLGRLRANQGDLVYEIPDDLDLSGLTSVGIWCDRFSSLFGAADLVAVG